MSDPMFADVALPLPVDRPFTYEVPEPLRARVSVGMRALVPVLKRVHTGYIVGLKHATEVDKVRPISGLPDDGPVFGDQMLELCRWISEYYCCSWGEALQCAVPAGISRQGRQQYRLDQARLGPGRYSKRQREVVAALHSQGPATGEALAKRIGARGLAAALRSLEARGVVIEETIVGEADVRFRTETWVRLVESRILPVEDLGRMQVRAPKQAAVYLDLLYGAPRRRASDLYDTHRVDSAVIRSLEAKGLVVREEQEVYRAPDIDTAGHGGPKPVLNDEQQAACDAIVAAAEGGPGGQTFLLKGVTGSGKTEVYLQAIERVLELGRSAIILVPEISLTPQTVGRFKARFEEDVAVLHSGLGPGERYDEWRRAQRGEVRIVVGARSAVFAPLADLGVIVVDEEQDTSYKQGETPRYHARDVAIMRARLAGAVCVLGSATPSVESYHNSLSGKSVRIELSRRATDASLPRVHVVDMRDETKEAAGDMLLSRALEEAIADRVRAGEQVLLLLNRRGFSPFVLCPKCGWVPGCDDCQVTLTYHARGARMLCHYCNAQRPVPAVCAECGHKRLAYLGTGTQKVEDFLKRSFPDARIERMDADTTSGKGGHARILGRLAAGEIDILVGTQMIAKGHDYPRVTLVGVLNADTGLRMPDFRAAEQAFQLITQVAGRAGRGNMPGTVYIQTFRPNHFAVQAAARQDYEVFFAREIEERRAVAYPPFRRMANLMVESEDSTLAYNEARALRKTLVATRDQMEYKGVEVLGPAPATVRRVKKKYRWNLGLTSRSARRVNALCRAARNDFEDRNKSAKVQLKIDVDPYGVF